MYSVCYIVHLENCETKMTMVIGMTGERINYLSVALRARGAIKTLKSLINSRQGVLSLPNNDLLEDLQSVLRSLTNSGGSGPLRSKLANEAPYRPFEELQTFEEVTSLFKDAQTLSHLESLLNGGYNEDNLRTAIRLFSAVERAALNHYNDPSWAHSGE